jgi:isocitrate lyase
MAPHHHQHEAVATVQVVVQVALVAPLMSVKMAEQAEWVAPPVIYLAGALTAGQVQMVARAQVPVIYLAGALTAGQVGTAVMVEQVYLVARH